jgi:hypothetical protein
VLNNDVINFDIDDDHDDHHVDNKEINHYNMHNVMIKNMRNYDTIIIIIIHQLIVAIINIFILYSFVLK